MSLQVQQFVGICLKLDTKRYHDCANKKSHMFTYEIKTSQRKGGFLPLKLNVKDSICKCKYVHV